MALPWPHGTPTLPRPVRAMAPAVAPTSPRTLSDASASRAPATARLLAVVNAPLTGLVVMLAGLALLFVLPLVGLPFVALVVLPTVVYHLRADRRSALRRTR